MPHVSNRKSVVVDSSPAVEKVSSRVTRPIWYKRAVDKACLGCSD